MLKVYFTASTSYNGEFIPFYKKIINLIKQQENVTLLSGNQTVNRKLVIKDKELSFKQIFLRERKLIEKADFVIAEVSKPSLGVGSEIFYALACNKPVLALVKAGYEDKISPIIAGNPSENLFMEFYKPENIRFKISEFINYVLTVKNRRGKLIVIDGSDGSGKTTQSDLLVKYFKKINMPIKYLDFPQYYQTFHGKIVARFLRGELGNIDQVSPYLISLAYALDRASVKKEMDDFLKNGGLIIANRYVTSNMAHQSIKFKNKKNQEEYLKWVQELEYKVHKIPKENLVIYLYVPWQIGLKLTDKKTDRPYLKGKKDIFENDINHRIEVEKMYLLLAKNNKHWLRINCVVKDKLQSTKHIHFKIIKALKERGLIQ